MTDVDVCALLREVDLDRVLEDAGVGEAPPADEADPDAGVPALVTGQCSWPSIEDPALTLHYLAPTTAADGPTHLADVLETGTGFAEGGRVITEPVEGETIGILVDDEQIVREMAVVKRSALLYFLMNDEVSARDTDEATMIRVIDTGPGLPPTSFFAFRRIPPILCRQMRKPALPALANAIAAATGARVRELPLTRARVREALERAGT